MTTKASKRYVVFGIIFSIVAILFAILYCFKIISTMDVFLAVTYVSYFVGIALMYNGGYHRENGHTKATALNFLIGGVFILLSIALLVYGFVSGTVTLFS